MRPRTSCSTFSFLLTLPLCLEACTLASAPAALRTVRAKVVVDAELRKKDPLWEDSARGLVEAASDFFEREFGIKLVTRAVRPWRLDENTTLTWVMLEQLKETVPVRDLQESYDVVIGFTGRTVNRYRGRARVDRIGNCRDGLGNYVVSVVTKPFHYRGALQEPDFDTVALIHELGHIFGAEHVNDLNSIMHENFGHRLDFDEKNRQTILRNRSCPFADALGNVP